MKDSRDGLPAASEPRWRASAAAGYAVMAPLVEAGIEKALEK
jgi:hypothetical protein